MVWLGAGAGWAGWVAYVCTKYIGGPNSQGAEEVGFWLPTTTETTVTYGNTHPETEQAGHGWELGNSYWGNLIPWYYNLSPLHFRYNLAQEHHGPPGIVPKRGLYISSVPRLYWSRIDGTKRPGLLIELGTKASYRYTHAGVIT